MREKIILLNPPAPTLNMRDMYSSTVSKGLYCWPQVDLLVLSGILSKEFNIRIVDANALRLTPGQTMEIIRSDDPFALIIMAGSSSKRNDLGFAKEIKDSFKDMLIIGEGGFLRNNPVHEMKENHFLDAILLNFISDDIVGFLKGDTAELNNLAVRRNSEIYCGKLKYDSGYFSYPLPKHEQLNFSRYRLSHGRRVPLTSVLSSYGCVGKCAFCVSSDIPYAMRDVNNLTDELKYVEKLGIKEVFFRDVSFGSIKKHALELCKNIIESKVSLGWVCDMRADSIDEERLSFMKRAGCHTIHIGVESANQYSLDRYSKNVKIATIETAFKLCHKHGIKTIGYFIIGMPGEKEEDIQNTIDFAIRLRCDYASFNFAIPVVGSQLRKECLDNDWLNSDNDSFDGSFSPVIEAGNIAHNRLKELRNFAFRKFYFRPSYMFNRIIKLRTIFEAKMLVLEFFNIIKAGVFNFNISSSRNQVR